jgi:hypothetical protein
MWGSKKVRRGSKRRGIQEDEEGIQEGEEER